MKTIKKDGKKHKLVDIGRGQMIWKESKPIKFITFIKSFFKWKHCIKRLR